jgi:DNA adenine methylase
MALYVAQRHPEAKVWINDAYEPLVAFWRVLGDPERAGKLVDRVLHLKRTHAALDAARSLYARLLRDVHDDATDEIDRAVGFYVLNRCSFSGLTTSSSFAPQASEGRWTMGHIERLSRLTPVVARWRITHGDCCRVVSEPSSGSAPLTFLDPPYAISDPRLYGPSGRHASRL